MFSVIYFEIDYSFQNMNPWGHIQTIAQLRTLLHYGFSHYCFSNWVISKDEVVLRFLIKKLTGIQESRARAGAPWHGQDSRKLNSIISHTFPLPSSLGKPTHGGFQKTTVLEGCIFHHHSLRCSLPKPINVDQPVFSKGNLNYSAWRGPMGAHSREQ
jgi:hypothetical protein